MSQTYNSKLSLNHLTLSATLAGFCWFMSKSIILASFVYDPTASVPSVVYEEGPDYWYVNVREPSGLLYSRERYDKTGDIVYVRKYLLDGLGNTVALTDENGNVQSTEAEL